MDGLKELYRFQELSLRIRELGQQQASMVSDAALSGTMDRLARVSLHLASVEGAISDLKKKIKRLEDENAEECSKRKQSEKKLYDGTIVSSKELAQLQQKIQEYQTAIDANEERTLGLLEELETKEREIARIQKEEEDLSSALSALQKHHKERNNEYELEIAQLELEAAEVKPTVPEALLQIYQKMARHHHGIALAKLSGDGCGACHVALSGALLQRLRKEKSYVTCENCGRMIFVPY